MQVGRQEIDFPLGPYSKVTDQLISDEPKTRKMSPLEVHLRSLQNRQYSKSSNKSSVTALILSSIDLFCTHKATLDIFL